MAVGIGLMWRKLVRRKPERPARVAAE